MHASNAVAYSSYVGLIYSAPHSYIIEIIQKLYETGNIFGRPKSPVRPVPGMSAMPNDTLEILKIIAEQQMENQK